MSGKERMQEDRRGRNGDHWGDRRIWGKGRVEEHRGRTEGAGEEGVGA